MNTENIFGPQTTEIVLFLGDVRDMTVDQVWDIAASGASTDTAWYAAWDAAIAVPLPDGVRSAIGYAARDAARKCQHSGGAVLWAVWGAVMALAARHAISRNGFTWDHYFKLTEHVTSAGVRVHPDDPAAVTVRA